MITKEDLKIGQYVKNLYRKSIEHIISVNSQYAYTNLKNRIYPKDYNEYFALTEQEAKSYSVYSLNDELQDLLSNLQDLQEEIYKLSDLPYFNINTEEFDIITRVNEVLKEAIEND